MHPSLAAEDPAVRRTLRGDLDNILLKALEKDPARRYHTVNALAEDVRRHLEGRPVRARPATWRYREVRQLTNSYLIEIHDAIRDLPGSTAARRILVSRALEYLDRLSREASDDRPPQLELAAAYLQIGDVQGNPTLRTWVNRPTRCFATPGPWKSPRRSPPENTASSPPPAVCSARPRRSSARSSHA